MKVLTLRTVSFLFLLVSLINLSKSWPAGSNLTNARVDSKVWRRCANLTFTKGDHQNTLSNLTTCGADYFNGHKGLELNSSSVFNVLESVKSAFEKCDLSDVNDTIVNVRVNQNCELTLCDTLSLDRNYGTKGCKRILDLNSKNDKSSGNVEMPLSVSFEFRSDLRLALHQLTLKVEIISGTVEASLRDMRLRCLERRED